MFEVIAGPQARILLKYYVRSKAACSEQDRCVNSQTETETNSFLHQ